MTMLVDKIREHYKDKELYTVWYCKTLQNEKGIFYLPHEKTFIEATLDGDNEVIYLCEYKKQTQINIKIEK